MADSDNHKPPQNISEMQQLARDLYGKGKKNEAVGAMCDCIKLLSLGTHRQFKDTEERDKVMVEFGQRLKALEEKFKELTQL